MLILIIKFYFHIKFIFLINYKLKRSLHCPHDAEFLVGWGRFWNSSPIYDDDSSWGRVCFADLPHDY